MANSYRCSVQVDRARKARHGHDGSAHPGILEVGRAGTTRQTSKKPGRSAAGTTLGRPTRYIRETRVHLVCEVQQVLQLRSWWY